VSDITNGGDTSCNNGGTSYTPLASPVIAIAAAARISFAIKDDGTLWAWGSSTKGQLGDGSTVSLPYSLSPKKIGSDFIAVSAGVGHSLGLKNDGTLRAWGDNTFGQLGDGTTTTSYVPKPIDSGSTYTAVSAGYNFSLALKNDGTLWAWGDNTYGQLGDGTTTPSHVPIPIDSGSTYTAISAGTAHSLALKSDGTLWAWGDNTYGELGDNSTTASHTPKQIDSGYAAIAAGYLYSLAIKLDGTLMAWGNNDQVNLGTGSSGDKHVPTQIDSGFWPVAGAISASKFSVLGNTTVYYHSLALKNDGSLWAWGDNLFGQLGDGSLTPSYAPKQILVDSGFGFTAVSAGEDDHSLAIKNDGSLWAWGRNTCGALGDGTTNTRYVPIQVSK
jgi:alpha-tubulin suppressor-like RCC1 family protein